MKNVLVLYYTQSGQLLEIAKNVVADLEKSEEVEVSYYSVEPKKDFGFPWQKTDFFDAFPETFLQIPMELNNLDDEALSKKYDLIILAYQVWYLTPSIPINSFLKSEEAKKLLQNTPVITVSGSRNMWIMAQEKVKKLLQQCNAELVGNIALVDRHINHISVITIVKWMFSGEKKHYLGIFPKPGVSQKDIEDSKKFGKPILQSLQKNDYNLLQENLLKLNAVNVKPFLISTDKKANVLFNKWANFIIKKGKYGDPKRLKRLKLFKNYLLFAIWVVMPIVFIIFLLTYLPAMMRIKKDVKYYESVALKK